MDRTCTLSGERFHITDRELTWYSRLGVPHPTLSPRERLRRRLAHRNERKLYHRTCAASGKRVISVYTPESDVVVYHKDVWWGDGWDGRTFGQTIDFRAPFFEQFLALRKRVPRMNMILTHCENSDYSPYSVYSKNCYLASSCVQSEDVSYSYQTNRSRDCLDCSLCTECELCYECLYSRNCYSLRHSQYCDGCSDSWFLKNCIGCSHCIGCCNLRNKSYYLFNEPIGKERYEAELEKLALHSGAGVERCTLRFAAHALTFPVRATWETNNEECSGDNVHSSKHGHYVFDCHELEECSYIYVSPFGSKQCIDSHYSPNSELLIEVMSGVNSYECFGLLHAWDNARCNYAEECFNCSDLFGCVGLKRATHSILNMTYSAHEYDKLCIKLRAHMQETGEWGEYLPLEHSLFGYNETMAQDHFPLTTEEVQCRGWRWYEDATNTIPSEQGSIVPDSIRATSEDVLAHLLTCTPCHKGFKIMPHELRFYKSEGIPLPRRCFECRYQARMAKRAPWNLYGRTCNGCATSLMSPYAPSRPEQILCEACFTQVVV